MDGDASRVVLGGAAIVAASPPARTAVEVGLVGLALALLWRLGGHLWLPLYSRIAPSRVLENPNRAAILDLVATTPGMDIARVHRAMRLTRVVAIHHLRVLESHGLVVSRRTGRSRSYFPAGDRTPPARAAALLDETRARVLAAVRERALTQNEISDATGLARRLVAYHLARLRSVGLVEGDGARPKRYAAR